ncbi:MAG TPA: hypothetical protein ENI23_04780 [bacterium]|nr:hypothetical protein [bacterium]
MTDEQILKKAIEKAEKNGFDITLVGDIQPYDDYRVYEHIIFSHDFAKAFWKDEICRFGKECPMYPEKDCAEAPGWEQHLKWMVSEEDRLKYIEKFL